MPHRAFRRNLEIAQAGITDAHGGVGGGDELEEMGALRPILALEPNGVVGAAGLEAAGLEAAADLGVPGFGCQSRRYRFCRPQGRYRATPDGSGLMPLSYPTPATSGNGRNYQNSGG